MDIPGAEGFRMRFACGQHSVARPQKSSPSGRRARCVGHWAWRILIVVVAIVTLGMTTTASGQQESIEQVTLDEETRATAPSLQPNENLAEPSSEPSGFRWTFTPFAWLVSLDGDSIIRGNPTDVDAGFWDTLTESDTVFGLMGHVEGGADDWSLFLTATYAHVGVDDVRGSVGAFDTTTDSTSDLGWFELGGALPLIGSNAETAADSAAPRFRLDAYAGARITLIDLELDTERSLGGTPVSRTKRDVNEVWVEPFVGLRGRCRLSDAVSAAFRGDIGGFGAGSDFAWQTTASLAFELQLFGLPSTGFCGYRVLSQDYESGDFAWDVVAHGPIIGIEIRF
jgi:hypothetical protein